VKMVKSGFGDAMGSGRITAMGRPRMWRNWRWLFRVRSSPSKRTLPPTMRPARGKSPTIERHVVVLPLPDSPTSPSVSPWLSAKLTRSTAFTTRVPPKVKKCVWRSATCRIAVMRTRRALQIPQLRVEPNPEPIAEELGRENDQEDTGAGEHRQPPLADHQGRARLREHEPPGGLRRRHTDPEKGQRRLRDDHDADREARQHGRRVHDIGQNM